MLDACPTLTVTLLPSVVSACTTLALAPPFPVNTKILPVLESTIGGSVMLVRAVIAFEPRQGGDPHPTLPESWTKLILPLSSPTKIFWLPESKTGPVSLWLGFTVIDQATAGVPLNTPLIFQSTPPSSPT